MSPETIPTRITPPVQPRRLQASDKAQQLLQPQPVPPSRAASLSPFVKMTTKILPDQLQWLKEQVVGYAAAHPWAPKLTLEELVRIALDELHQADNLEERIRRYRT